MTISLGNITGSAQTGFTTPGYTVTADTAPDNNGKQWAITALSGTQANVDVHAGSKPFTVTFYKPKSYRSLGQPNPVSGVVANVPNNQFGLIVRKGVVPLAGQASRIATMRVTWDIPAGSDTAEPEDIRALVSAGIGALTQLSAGIGDTLVSNVF